MPKGRRKQKPPTAQPPGWLGAGRATPAAAPGYAPPLRGQIGPTTGPPPPVRFPRTVPAPRVPTTPAQPYLPTTLRTGAAAAPPGQAQGQGFYFDPRRPTPAVDRLIAQGILGPPTPPDDRQYTPPQVGQGAAPGGGGGIEAGGGGGGGGGGGRAAPAGVNPEWYAEFQRRHDGQTPEEFYARTGEGLPEAMADAEWARGFAEMYGRAPTDDDWRAHWFATRAGGTPEEREQRRRRRQKERKQVKREQKMKKEEDQRPPLYVPPNIIWR